MNLLIALIDGMISRVGLAALFGFALHMGCKGFWYGDALAGFMPMVIGGLFYLSGKWKTKRN
jgi:Na+-driven multidrug efflux pump